MAERDPKRLKKHHVRYQDIRDKIIKNKNIISSALDYLSLDSFWFCYVKIIFCDAAYPSSFTHASCFTKRNIDEQTEFPKTYTSFTDLFSCGILRSFVDSGDAEELTDYQMEAFSRLADFFENIKETEETINKARKHGEFQKDSSWAAVLGTHILQKLSVVQDITFDLGYSHKTKKCPCGSASCQADIKTGDNSLGNLQVWHGSLDILIGDTGIAVGGTESEFETESESETELEPDTNSAVEIKGWNCTPLEQYRSQLIAEVIVLSFFSCAGLTPLMCISGTKLKVFMYDKDSDMLLESCEVNLFVSDLQELNTATVLIIWFIINYRFFCTGIREEHKNVGFTSDFKSFLTESVLSVYEKQLQKGGCRHGKRGLTTLDSEIRWVRGLAKTNLTVST